MNCNHRKDCKKFTYCPYCGENLMVLQRQRTIEAAAKLQAEADRLSKLVDPAQEAASFSELAGLVSEFLTAEMGHVVKCSFTGLSIKEQCSNSHSAPKGKRMNWCGKSDDRPKYYEGATGRVSFFDAEGYSSKLSELVRGACKIFRICTGTGGAAEGGLAYSVTLWADDFKVLGAKMREIMDKKNRLNVGIRQHDQSVQAWSDRADTYVQTQTSVIKAREELKKQQLKLSKLSTLHAKQYMKINPEPKLSDFCDVTHEEVKGLLNNIE